MSSVAWQEKKLALFFFLCVLCVSVVLSTPLPAALYPRIHFTQQTQESQKLIG
ncbi:hypothetical protein [Microcystis aeruginosa]|uniref:hypothetical protein n=1 Tax=Microcystis aeruginosa TaxID=1126 RepID=UPI001562D417|nr:hypothetical protein [Microcystis aeruginosa]